MLARLLCALLALAWGTHAWAHAAFLSSSPPQGAVLDSAPSRMQLAFDEPVSPLVFKLITPDGTSRDLNQVRPDAQGLTLGLPALSARGTYAVSWRVISADGHPVAGAITFSLNQEGRNPLQADATHPARAFWTWLVLAVWYAALIGGIGLAGCAAFVPGLRPQRPMGLGLLAAAAAGTLLNLGLLGTDALDLPLAGLLQARAWHTAIATSFGLSAGLALLGLACAAASWFAGASRLRPWLALLSVILYSTALTASGHASIAPPAWLARPAVWLHALAALLWVGALMPLYCTQNTPTGGAWLLHRFSRAIPAALLILLASGLILTCLQLDTPAALWRTAYGRVLSAKLILVALLVALGAYNRYRLTGPVLAGMAQARRALRRVIFVEGIVAVTILALVALWRFTPPPRALSASAAATAPAVSMQIHDAQAMVDLTYRPAVGETAAMLALRLSTPEHQPLPAQELELVFSDLPAGIEPIRYTAHQTAKGEWTVAGLVLPRRDHWDVGIEILVSDFKRIRLETRLRLPP